MEQTQLLEILKTLSQTEQEQVAQFTAIPFFNPGQMRTRVGPLLEVCFEHLNSMPEQRLDKMDVYSFVFPDSIFVEGKLEKVMVEALKLVRSALLALNYFQEDNEFHQTLDYTEVLRRRGLETRYEQSMARLEKMQAESTSKNAPHFFKQMLLEGAIHYQKSISNQGKGDLNILKLLHATEIYYYLRRYALLSRYLLQLRVANLEVPEFVKIQLEETSVPLRYVEESPTLRINIQIFSIMKHGAPEISDVRSLFDLLLKFDAALDHEVLQEFYTFLRNFSTMVLLANRENLEICHTLHELNIDNLQRGFLHYEGKLSPSRYLGVSENAIRIKQFDWTLTFIESNKHLVHGENARHALYRLNLANYLFATGKFSECLDHIPDTSPFYDYFLYGKRLTLKSLYELQSDMLSYRLDNFKMYLSRTSHKQLPAAQRQTHIDFANFLTQIIAPPNADKYRSKRLTARIEANKKVIEWRWLLAKAKALK